MRNKLEYLYTNSQLAFSVVLLGRPAGVIHISGKNYLQGYPLPVKGLQTQLFFRNKQLKYPNIIALACSDRGAGNDPEAFRLVFI